MRRLLIGIALLALFLVAPPPAARAARATVTITDTAYSPASVRIAPNDDVFWCPQNTTKTHNVDFGNKKSLDMAPGSGCTWLTFQDSGTFAYHCDFVSGMSGTVIVGDGGGSSPAPTPKPTTTTATAARRATPTTAPTVRPTTTTARIARPSSSTSAFADVATTESTDAVVEGATSTTEGQVAIKPAESHGGSLGNALAIGASFAMLLGGTGYLVMRRRPSA